MRFSAITASLFLVFAWIPDSSAQEAAPQNIEPKATFVGAILDGQCEPRLESMSSLGEPNAVSISFDNNWVEVDANTPATVSRSCSVSIPILDVPPGYSCTVTGAEHSGYVYLEAGVRVETTVEHLWDFSRGPALRGRAVRSSESFYTEYVISASDFVEGGGAWSDCTARPLMLTLRTTISATNRGDRDAAALMSHDMATLHRILCRPC